MQHILRTVRPLIMVLLAITWASGTLSVYGLSPHGDVLRAWWQPGGATTWVVENLTDIAEKA